jgi:hypothetical protein
MPELVFVCDGASDIHHRQEHKNIGLQEGNEDVQAHENRRYKEMSAENTMVTCSPAYMLARDGW